MKTFFVLAFAMIVTSPMSKAENLPSCHETVKGFWWVIPKQKRVCFNTHDLVNATPYKLNVTLRGGPITFDGLMSYRVMGTTLFTNTTPRNLLAFVDYDERVFILNANLRPNPDLDRTTRDIELEEIPESALGQLQEVHPINARLTNFQLKVADELRRKSDDPINDEIIDLEYIPVNAERPY